MIDAEYGAFTEVLQSLARVFRIRCSGDEWHKLVRSYFNAFELQSISGITEAAHQWVTTERTFPKPIELLGKIPLDRRRHPYVVLPRAQAAILIDAERRGYEQPPPCDCLLCLEADICDRPLRFVPELEESGADAYRWDPIRCRVVTAGHWAHGQELRIWYTARDACQQVIERLKASTPPALRKVALQIIKPPKRPIPRKLGVFQGKRDLTPAVEMKW